MAERRYDEDEVRRIFEVATTEPERRPGAAALPASHGLTLGELQEIGREVGLAPDRIAEAAASLEARARPPALPRRTQLGMPVSVGRVVELPRAPTDREWELLLAELRQTFHASGDDRSSGQTRGWTNGNLHAYIEPSESGRRLRMGTTKGDVGQLNMAGVVLLTFATLVAIVMILSGDVGRDLIGPLLMGAMGSGLLGFNAVRLPRWADERERQFDHVADRARALLAGPAAPDDSG